MSDQEIITADGEIMDYTGLSSSMAVQLQKAEVDQLISTARAFPRSLKRVQSAIMNMATLDEESAEECMYALPRGGKPIKGPSIRFAEILKQSYGNCRAAARVVDVNRTEMYVEAEGIFHDLETNSSTTARVRRRISDKRGKVYNEDMIVVTGNAACSIAMRNAILAGVPKPLWRRAYETVQATIAGDVTTLAENREKALKALAAFGVKPEQIYGALGKEGLDDITVDDIGTLRGMYSALKNGEATVEEMFIGTVKAASQHEKMADPLSDEPIKPTVGSADEQEHNEATSAAESASTASTGQSEANSDIHESGTPSPDADESSSPSSSAGATENPSSVAPTHTDTTDTRGGSVSVESSGDGSAPLPSPEARNPEMEVLIRYARDVLPMAAEPDTTGAMLAAIEKQYAAEDFTRLSKQSLEKAKAISRSMRAIFNNETSLDIALEFYAEALGCSVETLRGDDNGV